MNWYELTKKYSNVPYKQGNWDIDEGLDIIPLIILFLKDVGCDIEKHRNEAKKLNDRLIGSTHDEVVDSICSFIKDRCTKVSNLIRGDIVFARMMNKEVVTIYCGQGIYLSCFKVIGCKYIKINNDRIKEGYRWIRLQ